MYPILDRKTQGKCLTNEVRLQNVLKGRNINECQYVETFVTEKLVPYVTFSVDGVRYHTRRDILRDYEYTKENSSK